MNWNFLPQWSLQSPKKHANNTSKPYETVKITVISLIHALVCDNKTCFALVGSIFCEHLFLNRSSHKFRHSQRLGSCQSLVHQIVLRIRLQLFKRWIALSTEKITIQLIAQLDYINWSYPLDTIYPVDSGFQLLSNQGLDYPSTNKYKAKLKESTGTYISWEKPYHI